MKQILCLVIIYCFLSFPFSITAQGLTCKQDTSLCYTQKKFNADFELVDLKIEKKKAYDDLISVVQPPLLIDVDGDCIPEIVTSGYENYHRDESASNNILIFDSGSNHIIKKLNTYYYKTYTNCFIFVKYMGDYEVIVAVADININPGNVRGRLVCYRSDNSIKWISDRKYSTTINGPLGGSLSITDFNQDGILEVFIYNRIFNATNGILLCEGGNNGFGNTSCSISIAVNLDDDFNDLELVAGYTVYKVLISNLNGLIGNQMIPHNISINGKNYDGIIGVADINKDGIVDIIASDFIYPTSFVYIYSFLDNGYKTIIKKEFNNRKFSNISIGKINNRDELAFILTENDHLTKFSIINDSILKEDWTYEIKDGSSYLGCMLYDFDNDGIDEIVYRDEQNLIILSAVNNSPQIMATLPCLSPTGAEYPIIGNIDGTEETKICIPCAESFYDLFGKLTLFGAPAGQRWAPARNIWHQYAYNPLFINDDGTVPQYMHNPATYKNGKYNNFKAQASILDEDGNYAVAAASLTGDISCTSYDAATGQYSVDFGIYNRQHASATAKDGVAVSFYSGNPETGGTLIGVYHTTKDIRPDSTLNGRFSFTGSGLNTLWMIVNTDRYPIIVSDTSYYGIDECDYTDNVYIMQLPQVTKENKEICGGDSYDFYGDVLTQAGQYTHETKNISGCDSIITVLSLAVTDIKTADESRTSCEHYVWNGQTYTSSGSYTYQTTSVNGCDSITTLHLTIHQPDQIKETKTLCDSYTWNNMTYTQSGHYTYQTLNIHGCDSTVTLDLKLYPQYQDTIIKGACDSYLWNGLSYTNSGTYTYTGHTTHGCDSVVTLQLTISDILYSDLSITHCDSYSWLGQTYDTSGDYSITGKSIYGCDSITTLHLTIHPSTVSDKTHTACDTYTWNNQTYTQSGDYSFKTQNIYGCDSTATLRLTIHPSTYSSASVNTCSSYDWNGHHYTDSGSYTYHTTNRYGCDSIATLHLTINQPDDVNTSHTACDSYTWNNQTYTETGDYTHHTQNIYGCDSTTTLQLTIRPSATQSIALTECDSLSYLGQTFRTSGIYKFNLQTQYGCDSLVSLNLTISGDKLNDTQSACGNYTWLVNNKTYDQSGIYTEKYQNISGCDSTIALNLTIYSIYTEQKAAEACAHYEWEATKQRYTQSGIYTTTLRTTQGCDSTITLSLTVHPEYEYHDTIVTDAPYWWPVSNETYDQTGIYSKAYVSEYACDSISYLHLTIRYQTDIYFPNVLTPDSRNGYFTGYSTGQGTMVESLTVYDRWGNLMYKKEHFPANEPESGWDGRYKGRSVEQGVYVWIAKIRLRDGSEATYTGDVTVVR